MQKNAKKKRANNFRDLIGKRFGRLRVVKFSGKRVRDGLLLWKCECSCGRSVTIVGKSLSRRLRPTLSCGCLQLELTRRANTTHGMKGARVYRIWVGMMNRCRNQNNKDYHRYGGRGIRVCKRWWSFENFYADVGQPPTNKHSIDRFPDNSGNYRPGNWRWATAKQQANNRRPRQTNRQRNGG